jgi:multimeric flavodoxin WrbA
MSMKIIGVSGSIRPNGNTDWMVNTVLDAAQSAGAQVDKVFLREHQIKYCTACDACHNNGGNCAIKDDAMQQITPRLLEADVIVIGAPNYFKNVSALTKNFMDRLNAATRARPKRLLVDKIAIGLCVGGEELQDTQYCEDAMLRFFKGQKMKTIAMIKARADKPGEVASNSDLEKLLKEIGKKLGKNEIDLIMAMKNIPEKHSVTFFKI